MRKIKIAQIGIGHDHAEPTFKSLKKMSDIFEIAGYNAIDEEAKLYPERLGVFEGYRQMSVDEIMSDPEIEAVVLETQEKDLTKYALMAAEKGKHIQMDKPGGMILSDFEKLISVLKEKKTVFHTGYMYRYNPEIIKLLEKIKKGELGEIFSVELQMNCRYPSSRRQWLEGFGKGGMTFFLGCHLIDIILQIQGQPENIIPLTRSTGIDGVTANDFGMVVFEYKNGVSFIKTTSEEKGGFSRRQLVVSGSKGTVEIKPLEMYSGTAAEELYTEKTEWLEEVDNEWRYIGKRSKSENFNRYDSMLASFAAMVRGEKENPYTLDYELELYKTVLRSCGMM